MQTSVKYTSFGTARPDYRWRIFALLFSVFLAVPALQAVNVADRQGEDPAVRSRRNRVYLTEGPCDTIYCINGKIIHSRLVSVNTESVLFWKLKRRSAKLKVLPAEKVFSIGKAIGSEQVVYRQDSFYFESNLTVEEMRYYVIGARDARRYYRSPMTTVGGFFVGAASAMVGFWATPVPFFYTLYVYGTSTRKAFNKMNQRHAYSNIYNKVAKPPRRITRTVARELNLKHLNKLCFKIEPEYMDNYIAGFEDEASARKAFNAAKGSAVGYLGLALASMIIFL